MTDNRSKYSFVLPLLFLVVLLLPILNSKFDFWHFERSEENRLFTDSLHIDFSHLDEFPKDCESYVNDNFSFRAPLLDLYHSMMFNVFNTSPHPDKTILGKHGWYFTSGKHKECYTGGRDFTSDTLDLFLNEWERRSKFMDDRGIKVYWMIAPIKHNIYPEELPFNIVPAKQSRVKQLRAHFKTSLPDLIIDPTSSLINAKKQEKTYYHLDNHWNFRGGKVATDLLLSRIRQDFPEWSFGEVPNFDWNDSIEKSGIHYVVLGMKDRGERREFPSCPNPKSIEDIKYEFPCTPGFSDPWEFERRFTIKSDSSGLKILFIRDSFGHQMMPFLREYFEESVFIFDAWQYKLNGDIIDRIKPDVVVYLTLDSNLEAVITNW